MGHMQLYTKIVWYGLGVLYGVWWVEETCCPKILSFRPDFLLVDLREFFFRFRVEGTKKKEKKALTGHFQSFFQSFFLISPEKKNSKTSKVNTNSLY